MTKIELNYDNDNELLAPPAFNGLRAKSYLLYTLILLLLGLLMFYKHSLAISEKVTVTDLNTNTQGSCILPPKAIVFMGEIYAREIKQNDEVNIEITNYYGLRLKGNVSEILYDEEKCQYRISIDFTEDSQRKLNQGKFMRIDLVGIAKFTIKHESILSFFK